MALSKEQMGAPHPDLNALAACVDGRLPEAERAALAAHLAGCSECRAIVATLARESASADVQTGAGPSPARPRFLSVGWLPIAATLALAATATLIVRQLDRKPPAEAGPATPAPVTPEPVPAPAPSGDAPPTTPVPGPQPSPADPRRGATKGPSTSTKSPDTRRGGVRTVNGKTFRLVAGEWVDSAYDPVDLLPVREAAGPDARRALLEQLPALAPYAALGTDVTVVHDAAVYKFRR